MTALSTTTAAATTTIKEKKMDRRTKKTRGVLRAAFTDLLLEKPYEKISVTEIAKRADVDRKTFYLHYDSIDALADEMLREEVERMSSALNDVTLNSSGNIDVLEIFRLLSVELVYDFGEKARILSHTNLERVIERLEPMFAKNIVEKDTLKLAEHLGPYLDIFVSFFCAGLLSSYRKWISNDSELPIEDFAALASAAVTGGIASLIAATKHYEPEASANT